jgi:spore coat protein U-like protein
MTATELNTLKRMWTLTVLTIALSTARLACATSSDMALTEEKIQMSNVGTLEYGSLSDLEKMRLFKKYEQDCRRQVTVRCDAVGCKSASM